MNRIGRSAEGVADRAIPRQETTRCSRMNAAHKPPIDADKR
jgi:hypothetical protein